ncbi:MAG: radical SAM protein, partial [Thermoplasmatales archaeon]|nr:radical SAM protein [Thermoplasmatales archaeon]
LEKIDTYFPDNKIKFNEIEDCNQPWITIDESKINNVFKKLFMSSATSKKLYVGFLDYLLKKFINEGHLLLDNLLDLPFDDFYTIRISEGCLGNCSYCSIKRALGRFQSKPFDQCITEFKKGLDAGFSNFFITAEDTGAYGKDIGKTFVDLLDELTKIKGNYSIGILEINPVWLIQQIDSFEGIIKRGKIKAINVPVQSGSNRILKLMHRYSNSEKIQDVLLRLKKAHPDLTLGTHVIVGFPTETEEEFKETLQLVKKTKINIGMLIPISIKQDTVAENIEPKITRNEISRRLKYGKKYLNQLGYKTFSKEYIFFGKKW